VQLLGRQAIIYGAGGFIDDYATEEEYRWACSWVAVDNWQQDIFSKYFTPFY
jgi:hypothetical protein